MSDLGDWFKRLPFFTRWWLALTVGITLFGRFGFLSPYTLYLNYELIISKFQIWRPFTATFYYPLSPNTGFRFLMNCYFLYKYSLKLETGMFLGRPADYCLLLLFNWAFSLIICLFAGVYFMMDPLVLSILYIWCQLNKDVIVNFWFGTQFKAMYLPWVLLAFNMILSGGGLAELIGIVVGHMYYYLKITYPNELGGASFLETPSILYKWFPNERIGIHGFGPTPQPRPANMGFGGGGGGGAGGPTGGSGGGSGGTGSRHNWGRGHVLGGH